MSSLIQIAACPMLSLDFLEMIAARHIRDRESLQRDERRVRVLDTSIPDCVFQFTLEGPAARAGDILALDPAYARLGTPWLTSARYYSDIRYVDRLREVIGDLCREADARSWWFWICWDLYGDDAFASAQTMLQVFAESSGFDWRTDGRRLSSGLQSKVYGLPPEFHGRVGAAIKKYLAEQAFTEGSVSFGDALPEIEPVSDLPADPTNCSICLVRADAGGCAALEAFVEVASRFRKNDPPCRFFANFISQYGWTFEVQDEFHYQGLQREQPFVILRLPGEPEWQGEGAEAITKLRALTESVAIHEHGTTPCLTG